MKVRTSVLALLGLAFASGAMAETVNCTAISAPFYTITASGSYCVTANLSSNVASVNWPVIDIRANDVVLDLNGYTIDGSAAGLGTSATAIVANSRQNITIRNGTIRGFASGISIGDNHPFTTARGHVIENILFLQNTTVGLSVSGMGNTIRNNRVVATGGSSNNSSAYGMIVSGPNARISNNDVIGVTSQAPVGACGICLSYGDDSMVMGNRISKMVSPTGLPSSGIVSGYGTNVTLKDNVIADASAGITFNNGSTGKYMGNMTQGVTTPYTGGTAAGSTNY